MQVLLSTSHAARRATNDTRYCFNNKERAYASVFRASGSPLAHQTSAIDLGNCRCPCTVVCCCCSDLREIWTNPTAYSAFSIDLSSASPIRGTGGEPAKREIQVPQETLELNIQLPIGSEEGAYEVSLRSGPNVLWSQVAQAHLSSTLCSSKRGLICDRSLSVSMTSLLSQPGPPICAADPDNQTKADSLALRVARPNPCLCRVPSDFDPSANLVTRDLYVFRDHKRRPRTADC